MLEEVKDYLRIDHDEEDLQILSLISASECYLSNSGVKKDYENELYVLAVKLITSQMYENRLGGSLDKSPSYCLSVQSIIAQLAYSGG